VDLVNGPVGVAYAVIRDVTPTVFLAEDIDVLHRVLAMELVAKTRGADMDELTRTHLRELLLEERWAEAVLHWMELNHVDMDVYTHERIYRVSDVPPDLIGAQLQFTPLFQD
jgi:hypothetical protein